jgi:HK97 family phage prohead protease
MREEVKHEIHAYAFAPLPLETKRAELRMASIGADGVFEGYASLFDIRDTCGDIVEHGAFAACLRRRGAAGVKMLWQHRPEEPIGVWAEIAEDARGLKVKGRLDVAVARAREALSLIRAGALDGLSIGFRVQRASSERGGGRRLVEIDLIEISIVTFPALPQARIGAAPPPRVAATELGQKLARLRMQSASLSFETKLRRALDRGSANRSAIA